MKKTILSLALATLALTACNNSSDKKDSGAPVQTPEVIETDYSICNQGSRSRNIEGQWRRDSRSGEIKMSLTMELKSGSVRMSNTCTFRNRSLYVSATTPSRYNSTSIEFLGSAQDSDSIKETDLNLDCSVELRPMTLNYKLQGQCLVLSVPNDPQELILVPTDY